MQELELGKCQVSQKTMPQYIANAIAETCQSVRCHFLVVFMACREFKNMLFDAIHAVDHPCKQHSSNRKTCLPSVKMCLSHVRKYTRLSLCIFPGVQR